MREQTIAAVEQAAEEAAEKKQSRQERKGLLLRRLLAVGIIIAVTAMIAYVILRTELLTPVLTIVPPVQGFIHWCIEDPERAWGAGLVLFMSNLGIYAFIEERLK